MNNLSDKLNTEIHKGQVDLFRIGSIGDGGYFINPRALEDTDLLLSGGISSNLEFEFDVFRFCPKANLIMIDPTVQKTQLIVKALLRFFLNKKDKKRYLYNSIIFNYLLSSKRCIHLKEWLSSKSKIQDIVKNAFPNTSSSVMLKLDIEGSEYDLLDNISENITIFNSIIIEFHDCHLKGETILNFIQKIKDQITLVHFNTNNSGGMSGNDIPKVMELVFLNKRYISAIPQGLK